MNQMERMGAEVNTSESAKDVMQRVARRVRELRKIKSLPRRVLSEVSGVSPRYLAQLEAGEGNISISLLHRVAGALDVRAEDLIARGERLDTDAMNIAALYLSAPAEVQKAVRDVLEPADGAASRAGRICLVGLRGAGKSTLGRKLSTSLHLPFVELTQEIEAHSGMPVPEVLALYGPDGYRKMEAEVLHAVLSRHKQLILAVSGGIVSAQETYENVLKKFHTIWLRATPGEHMERVRAQGDMRPMQGNPQAMAQLRELLAERSEAYARAEAQVDTSNRSEMTSLNDLLGVIAAHGFLEK